MAPELIVMLPYTVETRGMILVTCWHDSLHWHTKRLTWLHLISSLQYSKATIFYLIYTFFSFMSFIDRKNMYGLIFLMSAWQPGKWNTSNTWFISTRATHSQCSWDCTRTLLSVNWWQWKDKKRRKNIGVIPKEGWARFLLSVMQHKFIMWGSSQTQSDPMTLWGRHV